MSRKPAQRAGVSYYPDNVEFYLDKNQEWQWRVWSDNGNIIGGSTEGYKNRVDAEYNYCSLGLTIVESKEFERYFFGRKKK